MTARDIDSATLIYRLTGASEFEIDEDTGQIQVAPGVTLDRERTPSYEVTVTASDGKGGTDSITVTINVSNVNEAPTAVNDTATTDEDQSVRIDVLANDTDPDTERAALTVSVLRDPLDGTARVESDRTITYTPNANFAGENSFTYSVSDGSLSDAGSVTVTVEAVNDAPAFAAVPAERSVSESARPGDDVGAALTATDVDGDTLTYGLTGAAASDFEIDEQTGQITVAEGAALNVALSPYTVTVTADDRQGETAMVEVTITVTAGPVIIITGGGGGGPSGPSGPTPSEVDFEWTVTRDIEQLDGGNDRATGVWSDGTTLWVADNADGAGDAVYAYDRDSGERLEEREFALHETNRAPRGFWSDRSVVWVSDSGRERLFAYDLATGERLEEREFALAAGNSDARGIWSDEETMWVLDGRTDALFAYALASGELLAEYALDSANDDPRGIWSDGVTIWVSDHGAKRLIAYRLPVLPDAETDPGEEDADDDARELERVSDEEFTELSKASNNSPRGIWSDGDVMYVADESDDRVYSYNMPDAIDARLASLTLSGVDIGEFDPRRTDYEAVVADGVTETTVEAEAMQRRTDVAIDPPDADVRGGRPPGSAPGPRRDHGHRHLAGRQPDEGLPRAVPRDRVGSGPRSLAALPARRHLGRLQPRRLRGRQRRGAGQLRGEPGHRGPLRPARGRLRLPHPRRAGLRERGVPRAVPRWPAAHHAAGGREQRAALGGPVRGPRRRWAAAVAGVPARRHRRGLQPASSTRGAASMSWRPAREPGRHRPLCPERG